MSRRRVAVGRAAKNRRYVAAVRRQMDFIDGLKRANYRYADVDEFLRPGDELGPVLRGEVA